MSNPLPDLLALTSIADGSPRIAAPVRNNFSALQTAVNAIRTALSGGTAGALLYATDASDVAYLPDAPTDGQTLIWNAASGRWKPHSASGAGTELDYRQIVADVTGINATTEGTAQAVITGNSVTYDGSRVKVTFYYPELVGSGALNATFVFLRDATVLGQAQGSVINSPASGNTHELFDTPAAGAHTYAVKAFVGSNALTVKAGGGVSGALVPAFLQVTKA